MFDAVWPSAEAHAGAARRHLGGQLRPRRSRAQLAGSARGRLCGAATTRRCVPHTHLSSPGLAPKADSTLRSSRAVPHPSTNRALRRLTSEVRRDPVYSTRYGRQQQCWEERRSATLRRGNLPRRRERHKDMSTLLNCAPQNKLGAASSGGDPPTRCAERSSAGARAQKGPNPTACGSGRESTTPLSPAAPGPAALS